MIKKTFATLLISVLINTSLVSAYSEIDCSSDIIFESNSCNQCFDWWTKSQWDYIGLLIDDWINPTDKNKILYKEEQKMPEMLNLNQNSIVWNQTPSSDWFWEYSDEFDALYSENDLWYILEAWKRVTWLQSKMWYAYKLENNQAKANENIGLLVYPISTHVVQDDGTPSIDDEEHIECVLFKSAWASSTPDTKKTVEKVKKLPDTGPTEYILLLIVAMILWFGLIRLSSKS